MRIIKMLPVCAACAAALCGCSARELEDRIFVQAMELDYRNGTLVGGFGDFLAEGDDVEEIRADYQDELDKYLDLGHVRAIVLGEALCANSQKLREVLLELEQMPMISRNSLVFSHDYTEGESYLKELADEGRVPGEYLCDRYRNTPHREAAETLGELLAGI